MIKNLSNNQEFNNFSSIADEWWIPEGKFKILHDITPLRIEYIVNIFGRKKLYKTNILDLGCGGGLTCEPLCRLGGNITGVDFIKKNIEVAKKHAEKSNLKIEYLHQNLDSLIIKKKYNIILLLEVLEHLNNWQKIIPKIRKMLKPNGYVIVSTINRNILSKIFAIYFAENILHWIPKNTHQYNKLITPEELSMTLKNNNFKVLDVSGMVFNPVSRDWNTNKNFKRINYFCTAKLN